MAGERELLIEFRDLIEAIAEDSIAAEKARRSNDNPTNRRNVVRVLFSAVEAEVYQRKRLALFRHSEGQVPFTPAELALLREEQYTLNHKGEAEPKPIFLRLTENFQFSARMLCKAYGLTYAIDKSGAGWKAFCDAIAIRNRITHPKHVHDLSIEEAEFKTIADASRWYRAEAVRLIGLIGEKLSVVEPTPPPTPTGFSTA